MAENIKIHKISFINGLKEIESLECENIFLTSDSECNFSFYFTYGFKIVKEAKVKYKKEEITVYIESKRLK